MFVPYDCCYPVMESVAFMAVPLAKSSASWVMFCTKELEPTFWAPDHTPDRKVPRPIPTIASMATITIIHVTMPNADHFWLQ